MVSEVSKDTVSASSEAVERLEAEDHAVIQRCCNRMPKIYRREADIGEYVHSDVSDLIDIIGRQQSTLRSQAEALERAREAMTASGATKAAYHGDFKFQLTQWREDDDGEPEEYLSDITVPWTTVKEIMAAIAARAALTPEVKS